MAKVNDLLLLSRFAIQYLATGATQPTVDEVSEAAESGQIVPFLVELGQNVGVDVSMLENHLAPDTEAGRAVAASIASADNAIDAARKYGIDYREPYGLLVLMWWVIDQMPPAALNADNGF